MASSSSLVVLVMTTMLVVASTSEVAACGGGCPKPTPPPPPSPSTPTPCPPPPSTTSSCPKDTLKLGVCANVLGLVKVSIGKVPTGESCCPLLQGLADLEAAVCLCTALKANVLGINLDVPLTLTLLLNYCGKTAPDGFQCAA
ncbi:hypothetical protein U9M48_005786 [Paspalum notatum var. saurae]|uniref:Bifunctional inhibitor/plant lipid transfer protein/seed storage helical domain-containing protein n=1 Tax=Paspalum notatum var. saurae TaxID=547442 RepID=A0AAQ3SFP3_PASNO